MKNLFVIIPMACMLMACGQNSEPEKTTAVADMAEPAKVQVADVVPQEIQTQTVQTVNNMLASKGIIQSVTDVPVYTLLTSIVTDLNVKEGQRVQQGQLIATLHQYEIQTQLQRINSEIASARFQYETILVGQGYDPQHEENIPAKIVDAARIRSSLSMYENELELLNKQLEFTYIKAPVTGVLTDVNLHKHDLAQQGMPLCRIIDPEHLRVQFTILESEISHFTVGTQVKVSTMAYPNEFHDATVTDISPKVEANGMINLKATLADYNHLMTGMTAIVTR